MIEFICVASMYFSTVSAPSVQDCSLKAPIRRRYRTEPEEDAVVLDALLQHFKRHPQPKGVSLCITTPGYKSLTPEALQRLKQAGLSANPSKDCQFVENAEVWSASGAWRMNETTFAVQVSKSEFGHISVWLAEYEYRLVKKEGTWTIVSEKPSHCNPKEAPSGDDRW